MDNNQLTAAGSAHRPISHQCGWYVDVIGGDQRVVGTCEASRFDSN